MKYVLWGLSILAVIGLAVAIYILATKQPETQEPLVITRTVIREIPAKVSHGTTPSGKEYEIAEMDTTIVSSDKNTVVDIGVRYDEHKNLFDLKTGITTTPPIYKPRFIGLTAGIAPGFSYSKEAGQVGLSSLSIDAGVKIREKYSFTIFATTNKDFGARFGVDF